MTDGLSGDRSLWTRRTVALLLAAMAIAGGYDLATDNRREWLSMHVVVEGAFILFGALAAAMLWRGWQDAERSLAGVRRSLADRQAERDHWRARAQTALRGLGEAMDAQFAAWELTPAEKETAMLLLKGFSHKEVATLTSRAERTVRQHAVSVYRKSGLAGRAELAAFFFEDMLLPADSAASPPPAATPPADR